MSDPRKRVKRELREELILAFIAVIIPLAMVPAMMGYA